MPTSLPDLRSALHGAGRSARLRAVLGAIAVAMASAAQAAPVPAADVAAIYEAAGLKARNGAYVIEGCMSPLRPQTEAIDLAPQVRGVLVYVGRSSCFTDSEGGNVALFVKDADGRWSDRFGWLPGIEVVAQQTANAGWPDLGVANPGGCMPIYQYDGQRYQRHAQKALQPGGCQFRE